MKGVDANSLEVANNNIMRLNFMYNFEPRSCFKIDKQLPPYKSIVLIFGALCASVAMQ